MFIPSDLKCHIWFKRICSQNFLLKKNVHQTLHATALPCNRCIEAGPWKIQAAKPWVETTKPLRSGGVEGTICHGENAGTLGMGAP